MHRKQWPERAFQIHSDTAAPRLVRLKGRDRWALETLIEAGSTGCTPINHPGPRWSAYVLNLRKAGVQIETLHESHDGPFAGTHGRYVLRSAVTPAGEAGA